MDSFAAPDGRRVRGSEIEDLGGLIIKGNSLERLKTNLMLEK